MAETWTISEAARLCGCDRRTLQRAIHSGRLRLDAQYRLSREALLAAGYLSADMPQTAPQGTPHYTPQQTSQETPQHPSDLTPMLEALERLIHAVESVRQAVDMLRTEVRQVSQVVPREMSHNTPQATPRPTPHEHEGRQEPPQDTSHPTPQPRAGRLRSALGQRILTLLAAHPEGLSAEQIRVYVSPDRPIGDILSGMRRTQAVQALGEGRKLRYVLSEGKD